MIFHILTQCGLLLNNLRTKLLMCMILDWDHRNGYCWYRQGYHTLINDNDNSDGEYCAVHDCQIRYAQCPTISCYLDGPYEIYYSISENISPTSSGQLSTLPP